MEDLANLACLFVFVFGLTLAVVLALTLWLNAQVVAVLPEPDAAKERLERRLQGAGMQVDVLSQVLSSDPGGGCLGCQKFQEHKNCIGHGSMTHRTKLWKMKDQRAEKDAQSCGKNGCLVGQLIFTFGTRV